MFKKQLKKIRHLWHMVRQLSGDDAYERYVQHHAEFHAMSVDAPPALSRKDFFKYWQESKWAGINRCC
jgi:uncharacterized short protein YbdD (DUF466 family)